MSFGTFHEVGSYKEAPYDRWGKGRNVEGRGDKKENAPKIDEEIFVDFRKGYMTEEEALVELESGGRSIMVNIIGKILCSIVYFRLFKRKETIAQIEFKKFLSYSSSFVSTSQR